MKSRKRQLGILCYSFKNAKSKKYGTVVDNYIAIKVNHR